MDIQKMRQRFAELIEEQQEQTAAEAQEKSEQRPQDIVGIRGCEKGGMRGHHWTQPPGARAVCGLCGKTPEEAATDDLLVEMALQGFTKLCEQYDHLGTQTQQMAVQFNNLCNQYNEIGEQLKQMAYVLDELHHRRQKGSE